MFQKHDNVSYITIVTKLETLVYIHEEFNFCNYTIKSSREWWIFTNTKYLIQVIGLVDTLNWKLTSFISTGVLVTHSENGRDNIWLHKPDFCFLKLSHKTMETMNILTCVHDVSTKLKTLQSRINIFPLLFSIKHNFRRQIWISFIINALKEKRPHKISDF